MIKENITFIGMPSCGKSTIGQRLAAKLRYQFVDFDSNIEEEYQQPLKQLIEKKGETEFKRIEEKSILRTKGKKMVLSPGGSCIYSQTSMQHLKKISTIIYLDVPLPTIIQRLDNTATRGIIGIKDMTIQQLYNQRTPLYERYKDISIPVHSEMSISQTLQEVLRSIKKADKP